MYIISYCCLTITHCCLLHSVIPPTQGFFQGMYTFPLHITRADGMQKNHKCIPCNRNTNLTYFAFRQHNSIQIPIKTFGLLWPRFPKTTSEDLGSQFWILLYRSLHMRKYSGPTQLPQRGKSLGVGGTSYGRPTWSMTSNPFVQYETCWSWSSQYPVRQNEFDLTGVYICIFVDEHQMQGSAVQLCCLKFRPRSG